MYTSSPLLYISFLLFFSPSSLLSYLSFSLLFFSSLLFSSLLFSSASLLLFSLYLDTPDLANQTTISLYPDDQSSSSNATAIKLECSDGFYFDENATGLCLPECGEWSLIPLPQQIIERVFVIVCFIASMIMIIGALTVRRDTM